MPKVGDLLNERYRITKVIGQGGMGRVYLAEDVAFHGEAVEVAVKENLQKEAKEQFLREAAVLAKLRHASLPKVSDHFLHDDGTQYLVMEYVAGRDIREDVINHGSFTSEETATVGIRVCTVLEYLHSQDPPVIHRDIKPSNLKWAHFKPGASREKQRKETSVVLIDFGIVKVGGASEKTRFGGHGRTLGYSPIEQDPGAGSEHTNERSDIYALGATLFFLATGREPPVSTARVAEDTLGVGLADVDPALGSVIKKAMAVYSQDRYQSAEEFRQALEGLFTQRPFLLEDASAEDGCAVLRWTAGDEADFEAYEIHASEDAGFTPSSSTLVETVTRSEVTTIELGGLRRGASHHLRVRLVMQSRRSRTSNELSVQIPLPPPPPIVLESPQSRRRSMALKWTPTADPSHFEKYEVHAARVPGFTISEATLQHSIAAHATTKAVVRGMEPKTPYYFKIRLLNVDGQEAVSNEQVGSAKASLKVRPTQVGLFILAMALGALLISTMNPGVGTDSWQSSVAGVPGVRGIRHSLDIASRDEQRVTLRRSRERGFAKPEIRWTATLTEEQIDKRIKEEAAMVADEGCGETIYFRLERIDWRGEFLELEEFQLLSPLCEPRVEVAALPPDNARARVSWSWKGSRESFAAYGIHVGRNEETLWTDANRRAELYDFERMNAVVELECGANYVGLWIQGPDTLSVTSEVMTVSGPDCPLGVPSNVQVRPGDDPSNEVVVDWSWNESEPPPAGFRVEHRRGGSLRSEEVGGSQRSLTIRGLQCNQTYDFTVVAVTAGGVPSEPSGSVSGSTGPCPTPDTPSQIEVTRTGEASARVTWDWSGDAATLSGFRIVVEGRPDLVVDAAPGERNRVLDGLACDTEYRIRVLARGSGGSIDSQWFTYLHSCPLSVPMGVRIEPSDVSSHSSLVVSWDYTPHGLLESFLVECEDPTIPAQTVQASNRRAVFTGLIENTTYRFRVRAVAGQEGLSSSFSGYVSGSTTGKKLPSTLSIPGHYETLTEAIIAVSQAAREDLENPDQPVTLQLEPNSTHILDHSVADQGYSALRFANSTVIEGNNARIRIRSTVAPNAILLDQPGKTVTFRNLTVDAGPLHAIVVTAGMLIIETCTMVSGNPTCVSVRESGSFIARGGSDLQCTSSSIEPRRSLLVSGSSASATLRASSSNQTIQAKNGARLELIDATVTGDPESGVILRAGAGGRIEGSVIRGGNHGVVLNASADVRIVDCEITGGPEGVGIYCEAVGSDVHIVRVEATRDGCP